MTTRLLAIDPGPQHSGVVEINPQTMDIYCAEAEDNEDLLRRLRLETDIEVAIEVMQSMGMAVAQSTFDTQLWAGRFIEAVESRGISARRMFRRDIKLHLCGQARAKDPNVTAAAKGRFPPTGGGKDPYKGTAKQPGPLYGISGGDVWSALAIAITYLETQD